MTDALYMFLLNLFLFWTLINFFIVIDAFTDNAIRYRKMRPGLADYINGILWLVSLNLLVLYQITF